MRRFRGHWHGRVAHAGGHWTGHLPGTGRPTAQVGSSSEREGFRERWRRERMKEGNIERKM